MKAIFFFMLTLTWLLLGQFSVSAQNGSQIIGTGYLVAAGAMAADQVIVDGTAFTWQSVAHGSDQLTKEVSAVFQQQIIDVYAYFGFTEQRVKIKQLVAVATENEPTNRTAVTAQYNTTLPILVPITNETESSVNIFRINLELILQDGLRDMARKGLLEDSFGVGTVVVTSLPNITVVPMPGDEVTGKLVAIGEMSADAVLVDGQLVTWESIASGGSELFQTVYDIFQLQIIALYDGYTDYPEQRVKIPDLVPTYRLDPAVAIAAEYETGLPIIVVVSTTSNFTGAEITLNNLVEGAAANMSRDGLFDAAFGVGTNVTISVTHVTAHILGNNDDGNDGLSEGAIIAIAVCSAVVGGALIVGLLFSIMKRHRIRIGDGYTSYK